MTKVRTLSRAQVAHQRGLTIVELMISMVLALVLTGGVVQVMTSSQSSYRELVQQARMQETAKLAMEYLVRDIRMAGYWGCNANNINIANAVRTNEETYFDPDNALTGYDKGTSSLPDNLAGDATVYDPVVDGTDIVEMRLLDVDNGFTVASHAPSAHRITLTERPAGRIREQDIVAMVDSTCSNIGIFAVTRDAGSSSNLFHFTGSDASASGDKNCTGNLVGQFDCDNLAGALGTAYSPGSSLYSVGYVSYGIRPSNQGDQINGLWRIYPNANDVELVEGVQDLQVEYGLDTNADNVVDRFASAADIGNDANLDFQQAIVMRITVTIRSLEDASFTDDFSTSIRLRNRGI